MLPLHKAAPHSCCTASSERVMAHKHAPVALGLWSAYSRKEPPHAIALPSPHSPPCQSSSWKQRDIGGTVPCTCFQKEQARKGYSTRQLLSALGRSESPKAVGVGLGQFYLATTTAAAPCIVASLKGFCSTSGGNCCFTPSHHSTDPPSANKHENRCSVSTKE